MTNDGAHILSWIQSHSVLKTKVYYIRGDVHDDDHLRRAKLIPDSSNCKGIFLLCQPSGGAGNSSDDAANVMRLQGLRKEIFSLLCPIVFSPF